ncbi:Tn3 family transposase [Actinomadura rugatobispora]|uniref:Tn3 family transposase n=1 Tax=Actinomadura rugatobispora TaxID=1994 RepID=A0ABW0ZRA1_9ACTN|nr:hypothetical protein GCM10010200_002530 [Actinomadura rugatobispora]
MACSLPPENGVHIPGGSPEILGNATDTHGVTPVHFALFDLLGLQLSPRIRDLGEISLYRTGPASVRGVPTGGAAADPGASTPS